MGTVAVIRKNLDDLDLPPRLKEAIEGIYDFLQDSIDTAADPADVKKASLTIASGVINLPLGGPGVTNYYVDIDTEGGASTDDLDTMNGGKQDDIAILRITDPAHDVVLKNNIGNLIMGADFTMPRTTTRAVFVKFGTVWTALVTRAN